MPLTKEFSKPLPGGASDLADSRIWKMHQLKTQSAPEVSFKFKSVMLKYVAYLSSIYILQK